MSSKNIVSTKLYQKIWTHLVLGITTSFVLIPASKVVAGAPSAYLHTSNQSWSYSQCQDKVTEAANLVLSSVGQPSIDEQTFILVGQTRVTTTTMVCTNNEQGTTLMIVSSGDDWNDSNNEAKSIRDRLVQVISGNL